MNRLLPAILAACLLLPAWAAADDSSDMPPGQDVWVDAETHITLDPLGNASVTRTSTFTAAQFGLWQMEYGQDKGLLKRDLEKTMSGYQTSDWGVSVDEMNRIVTLHFNAQGVVKYQSDGHFAMPIPSSWIGGDLAGNTAVYHYERSLSADDPLREYTTVTLALPAAAANIAEFTADDGCLALAAVSMSVALLSPRRKRFT